EFLRTYGAASGHPVGWRPNSCAKSEDFLWGTSRFAIGLWVGGNVTPNRLKTIFVDDGHGGKRPLHGAVDLLKGADSFNTEAGEPAQALECPACRSSLAIPELSVGEHMLFWIVEGADPAAARSAMLAVPADFRVLDCQVIRHSGGNHYTLQVRIACPVPIPERSLDSWVA